MNHIYLDLDGTLTDNGQGIIACLNYAADSLGAELIGDPRRFIGPQLRDSFREILGSNDRAKIERATALYRERYETTGIFENEVYPGIPEALYKLHSTGHQLSVVTAKPQVYARQIVDHFQLGPFLHAVYGPDLKGYPKTKTELLAQVLAKEGATSEHARMVGDRSYDMEAARLNAVMAIGVQWGYGTASELKEAGADVLVESAGDLVRVIDGAMRDTGQAGLG